MGLNSSSFNTEYNIRMEKKKDVKGLWQPDAICHFQWISIRAELQVLHKEAQLQQDLRSVICQLAFDRK